MKINCLIKERNFEIELADSAAGKAFLDLLPLSLSMQELNGNEKYRYLDATLPSDPKNPGAIEEGDFMLFGDSCIVLFYKSFSTSYSYTRLGKLCNLEGYQEALGAGDVQVTFSK